VDARWQQTTTPYGPGFLLITKGVVALTGEHVILGVLVQRLVELLGVAMIVWAVPRLARRCGMDPVAALWMAVLNPLVLFHLIAGGHNEALMLGAMLAGLVLAVDRHLLPGVALIALAVSIKATAAMALPFLVILLARRRGGRWRDLIRIGLIVAVIAGLTFLLITWLAGTGFGWVSALNTPGSVRSFLSVSTSLGVGAGFIGLLLGLGDHTNAAIDVMQPLGTVAGALISLVIMWQCWKGRMPAILGLGIALGAFVLLGPVIQPWYLLWAVLPLAAATADLRYRRTTVWLTAVFAVIIMPNGGTIPVFTIVQALVVAAVVVGAVLFGLWRTGIPELDPGPPEPPTAADQLARPDSLSP
jgi:alpha-1,6-mannosyltransferase